MQLLKKLSLALMTVTLLAGLPGCGLVNTITGAPRSVSALWPDVPAPEAALKGDFEMPLMARAILRTISSGVADSIAYSTAKTPAEVEAYYSVARMRTFGWVEGGCASELTKEAAKGASSENAEMIKMISGMVNGLNVCGFTKTTGADDEVLLLLIAPPDAAERTPSTKLFFIRGKTPKQ